ncbi:MAG: peptide deformylase [Gammaproteobacteria bacterium]
MSKLTVLHFPDPRLRKKGVPVETISAEIRQLAADMLETMYDEEGIGLAATQVNVQKRVVVIDISGERNSPMVLINPEIIDSTGSEEMQEGCLSVPGFFETVQRAEFINYQYLNLKGELIKDETGGILAVCIQHEIDHLDGKLFIDYLSPLKKQRIRKKIKKQERTQSPVL